MSTKIRNIWLPFMVLLSLFLSGCNEEYVKLPTLDATALTLTPTRLSLPVGFEQQMDVFASFTLGTMSQVTSHPALRWESSNDEVVTVNAQGIVTAHKVGEATITVSAENNQGDILKDTSTISVNDAVPVSLVVTPKSMNLAIGLSQRFKAEVLMSNSERVDITRHTKTKWSSNNETVATVSNHDESKGEAQARNEGLASITASATINGVDLEDDALLLVNGGAIEKISITPVKESTPAGFSVSYTAMAYVTGGAVQDITNSSLVSWSSSRLDVASITTGQVKDNGVATGKEPGETEITATALINGTSLSDSTTLTVSKAVVTDLSISPKMASIAGGADQQFEVNALFSDGNTLLVTHQNNISWTSSDDDIATVESGLATAHKNGSVIITASGITPEGTLVSDEATLNVGTASLVSIQITETEVNLQKNTEVQLEAIGTYSDNTTQNITSSVNWLSDSNHTATVSTLGLVHAVEAGTANITADKDGIESNVTLVTVSDATLMSIEVTPAKLSLPVGVEGQLTAIGTYSDSSTQDITSVVSWKPETAGIVSVSVGGKIKGNVTGTTNILASKDGIESEPSEVSIVSATLESISVEPSTGVTVAVGLNESLKAMGTYSGSDEPVDITSSVFWVGQDVNTATVADGVVQGKQIGHTTTTALKSFVESNPVKIDVTSAELEAIDIEPKGSLRLPLGLSKQLTAYGIFSDGTRRPLSSGVSWIAQEPKVFVHSNGMLVARESGETAIKATFKGIESTSTHVSVTDAVLQDISVTPAMVEKPVGFQQELTVEGLYSDGKWYDLNNVEWKDYSGDIVTVETNIIRGINPGRTSVYAFFDGVDSNEVEINISQAVPTKLSVSPLEAVLPIDVCRNFTATVTLSDGNDVDVTKLARWTTDKTTVLTIKDNVVCGLTADTAEVIANFRGLTARTSLTVDSVIRPIRMIVNPDEVVLFGKNTETQLSVAVAYNDGGALVDKTADVTYSTSNSGVVVVTDVGPKVGTVTAVSEGFADITIEYDGLSTIIPVEVNSPVATLLVTPNNGTKLIQGEKQPFEVTAVSSAISYDVTRDVDITVRKGEATINQTAGVFTPESVGSLVIEFSLPNSATTTRNYEVLSSTGECDPSDECIRPPQGEDTLYATPPTHAWLKGHAGLVLKELANHTEEMTNVSRWLGMAKKNQFVPTTSLTCDLLNAVTHSARKNWKSVPYSINSFKQFKKFQGLNFETGTKSIDQVDIDGRTEILRYRSSRPVVTQQFQIQWFPDSGWPYLDFVSPPSPPTPERSQTISIEEGVTIRNVEPRKIELVDVDHTRAALKTVLEGECERFDEPISRIHMDEEFELVKVLTTQVGDKCDITLTIAPKDVATFAGRGYREKTYDDTTYLGLIPGAVRNHLERWNLMKLSIGFEYYPSSVGAKPTPVLQTLTDATIEPPVNYWRSVDDEPRRGGLFEHARLIKVSTQQPADVTTGDTFNVCTSTSPHH